MVWVIFALMTAAAVGALLLPLWRGSGHAMPRAAYDLEIYRDQLAEVERDLARGLIAEQEARAARTEIARRALAAGSPASEKPEAETPRRAAPVLALAAAGVAPLIAIVLYLQVGSPGLPGQPLASRIAQVTAEGARRDEELLGQLVARLREQPDDLQGWLLLARSYATLGRPQDAVEAWRQVRRIAPDRPEFAGALGEALVQAADGTVTPEALALFESVMRVDDEDPRGRFYVGMARAQAGDSRTALQMWTDLVAISPPDAPWLPVVRTQIARLASEAKIDPATLAPSTEAAALAERNAAAAPPQAPPAERPAGADAEAIARMAPEERQQMIRSMVDSLAARLETQPDDVEGWRRLGRARRVLGELDKSVEAYAKAATLAPRNIDVLSDYAGALFERVPRGEKLPEDFVAVMRRILDVDPNHGDALWFVGLAEAEAGRRAAAVALWQRLVERLPPGSKEHHEVQAQIDRLKRQP
jgi:cytochrome c-type biogenesis protein CcmH